MATRLVKKRDLVVRTQTKRVCEDSHTRDLVRAAQSDSVAAVTSVLAKTQVTLESVITALVGGNFNVAHTLISKADSGVIKALVEAAQETGSYPILTYLVSQGRVGVDTVLQEAVLDRELLKLVLEKKGSVDESLLDAAANSPPEIFEYLLSQDDSVRYYAMKVVTESGNLPALEYLVEGSEELPYDLLFLARLKGQDEAYDYLLPFYPEEVE